jgi:hypothetical protein
MAISNFLWKISSKQCTENSEQIFPEMKLRDLAPNFYIHVSVSDLYISYDRSAYFAVLHLRTDHGNI